MEREPTNLVTVHVSGLRHARGVAMVALFDAARASREPEHALHVGAAPITDGEATMIFRDVISGRYAAALLRSTEDATAPGHADVVFEVDASRPTDVELVPHELLHAP